MTADQMPDELYVFTSQQGERITYHASTDSDTCGTKYTRATPPKYQGVVWENVVELCHALTLARGIISVWCKDAPKENLSDWDIKWEAANKAVVAIQEATRQQHGRVDALVKALEDNLKTFKAIEEGTSKHPNIRGIAPGLCNFIFGCTHEAIKFTEFSVQQVRRAFKGE